VVRSTKHKNGLTTFECISDTQEKKLFARLGQTISNNMGDDQHQTPVSNWFKLIKLPYLSCSTDILIGAFIDISEIESYSFYTKNFQSISFSVDSPPPQVS
jgi:hypothetical protein